MTLVLVEREPPVAVVLLNRPEALNALSDELMDGLVSALEELDRDESVRAIVLGGSERAFAAGADIGELAEVSAIELYYQRAGSNAGTRSARSGRRSSRPSRATASAVAASSRCRAT